MNDSKSRALLTTALHPSSSPNERLMALAAFNRIMERAGLHASDIAIYDASAGGPRNPRQADDMREAARREAEIASLTGRIKAQEAALRRAVREKSALEHEISGLRATLGRAAGNADEDACQIAALEADIASRDRAIHALETRLAARTKA